MIIGRQQSNGSHLESGTEMMNMKVFTWEIEIKMRMEYIDLKEAREIRKAGERTFILVSHLDKFLIRGSAKDPMNGC